MQPPCWGKKKRQMGHWASQTPKLVPGNRHLCSLLKLHFKLLWSQDLLWEKWEGPSLSYQVQPSFPCLLPTNWAGGEE